MEADFYWKLFYHQDDDDEDDDELFLRNCWRTKASFPAGTIVRDFHHRKSLTCRERDLNLWRTRVQILLHEVVQK